MVNEQLLEDAGEAPELRFGETADGESPRLLLDLLPRRVRNRSLTNLASSRSARFFFLSSSEMLMSGSWSFTRSMTCPEGSTEVSEAVETFRCRWESLRWGLGALLTRFVSVSPPGELASPVRMIVGGLQNGPKTELFLFPPRPASLHSGELLPFKVNVTSGSRAPSCKALAAEPCCLPPPQRGAG